MGTSLEIKGLGVSAGIGIGRALLYEKAEIVVPEAKAQNPAAELQRLDQALALVTTETEAILERARTEADSTRADIIEAYAMILGDPEILLEARRLIEEDGENAVRAVESGVSLIVQMFEQMEDAYMRERAFDIRDIKDRLLRALLGIRTKDISKLPPGTVLVAKDLATSDTAGMDIGNVAGILTKIGGRNAHTSIMARNFSIPAVVGIGSGLDAICDGDEVALDGTAGLVSIRPDAAAMADCLARRTAFLAERALLDQFRGRESLTADGRRIEICANIGTTQETSLVLESTADGIGLFRSEFLYLDKNAVPTEDEQLEAYRSVLMALGDKPVIVRTLDIGGDKAMPCLNLEREENPFLGYRAIRICLDRQDLFRTQLRALLRASVAGNLQIMFPMISSVNELRLAKAALEAAKAELRDAGVPFRENVPVGIMIEIPAAAVMSDRLARECDFFSIGTNDLIQYTVAVDRGNEKVANLYSPYHPAVLRLVDMTIRSAHAAGIPCGMCGEAAGDPLLIPALLGMGLDEFSMGSGSVLQARKIVARLGMDAARTLAETVLELATAEEVENALAGFARTNGLA